MDPVVKSGHCPNQRSARYGSSGWESECEVGEPGGSRRFVSYAVVALQIHVGRSQVQDYCFMRDLALKRYSASAGGSAL